MQILTSTDGENWTLAKEVRGNADFFQTIVLDNVTEARYVKWQGIASNASSGVYMIQEFMVYEYVDKTALDEALNNEVLSQTPGNVGGYQFTDEEEKALYDAVAYAEALLTRPDIELVHLNYYHDTPGDILQFVETKERIQ